MLIFKKENGTLVQSSIPFKNLKTFFNMSKITTFKPVLQRDGQKNSHAPHYKKDIKILTSLS